jgi:hypothetical protein
MTFRAGLLPLTCLIRQGWTGDDILIRLAFAEVAAREEELDGKSTD